MNLRPSYVAQKHPGPGQAEKDAARLCGDGVFTGLESIRATVHVLKLKNLSSFSRKG